MGLALILIGVVLAVLVSGILGIILIACGLVLLLVPGTYGLRR